YYADAPRRSTGLARTPSRVSAVRAQPGNSSLPHPADIIQGDPVGDYLAYDKGLEDSVHPIIAAMNTLGYEAATLGNHEFNYGLDYLDKALAGAEFPFVSANLVRGELAAEPLSDTTYIKPYIIVEKQLVDGSGATQTIKIGLV